MTIDPFAIADQIKTLTEHEFQVLRHLLQRKTSTRNSNAEFDASLTFGQRVADQVAAFGGSWTFILLFMAFLIVWIIINSIMGKPFDPFPYILLNLFLSINKAKIRL